MSASKKANDNSGMSWPHLRARRRSEHIPPSSAILRVSRPSRTKLAVVPEAAKMAKRILAERLCLGPYQYKGKSYSGLRSIYSRCTRCGRGGLAIVLDNGSPESAVFRKLLSSNRRQGEAPEWSNGWDSDRVSGSGTLRFLRRKEVVAAEALALGRTLHRQTQNLPDLQNGNARFGMVRTEIGQSSTPNNSQSDKEESCDFGNYFA
jgi:hypothetical protein